MSEAFIRSGERVVEDAPGVKEKIVFGLKCLAELVANDQIRVDDIKDKSTAEIIELAEAEANKAVAGAAELKNL
jgi:hypothetical protein